MNQNRRLYRCREDRRIAGVASGVAEFFGLDPSVVRLVWFLSIFFGGLGLFVYVAMAFIVPLEPLIGEGAEQPSADPAAMAAAGHRHAPRKPGRWSIYFGSVLVLFGGLALIDALTPAWVDSWRYLGPAFIIGIGAVLVAGALRREPTES